MRYPGAADTRIAHFCNSLAAFNQLILWIAVAKHHPTLLEHNQWLQHTIQFLVHDLKGFIQFSERKRVSGHACGINALHLQQLQESLHTQSTAWTETRGDGFFSHTDSPSHTRNMHVFALSMIADIRDKPSCLCDLNALLECAIQANGLDCRVYTQAISQLYNTFDNIFLREIDDHVRAIEP